MKLKKIYLIIFLGFSGPVLLVLSEFFFWFSDYNLLELYIILTDLKIEDSFLYLFPLLSGVICLIANVLIMIKVEFKIKSIILSFLGIGFQLLFFIDHISREIEYISNAGLGLYLGIVGFLLILINVIYILTSVQNQSGG
jgi:hypothetical protein